MKENKNKISFCPLTKENCREDCAWADIVYNMDEDGIDKEIFCSVAIIAGRYILEEEE